MKNFLMAAVAVLALGSASAALAHNAPVGTSGVTSVTVSSGASVDSASSSNVIGGNGFAAGGSLSGAFNTSGAAAATTGSNKGVTGNTSAGSIGGSGTVSGNVQTGAGWSGTGADASQAGGASAVAKVKNVQGARPE